MLSDGYDRRAAALQDRDVEAVHVESTIAGHGADLLIGRDLVQRWARAGL